MQNQSLTNTQRHQLAKIFSTRFDKKISEVNNEINTQEKEAIKNLVKNNKKLIPLQKELDKIPELFKKIHDIRTSINKKLEGSGFSMGSHYTEKYGRSFTYDIWPIHNNPDVLKIREANIKRLQDAKTAKEDFLAEIWGINISFEEIDKKMTEKLAAL